MNGKTLAIIAAAVVSLIIGNGTLTEYRFARDTAREFISTATTTLKTTSDAVGSIKATSDSAREALDEIKSRLSRLEAQSPDRLSQLTEQLDQESQLRAKAESELLQAQQSLKLMNGSAKPIGPLIVMHTSPTCGPCQIWKRDQLPKWKAAGWDVKLIEETASDRTWPWFEVYEGGKRFEVDGPLTLDSYAKAKAR